MTQQAAGTTRGFLFARRLHISMPQQRFATAAGGSNTFVPDLGKKHFDDEEYVTVSVPVFDEHNGQEENVDINFTPEVLKEIVEKCNARIADTGDYPPVTAGHTSDNPDDPKPEVLGFASRFSLGTIGKIKPRKAIYAELKIKKDKWAKAKELPRRSIELWPDMVIDPVVLKDRSPIDTISLLGADRPARDLGLMYSKNKEGRARYRREVSMNPEELITKCIEAWQATPEMAFLRELMAKAEGEKAEAPDQFDDKEAVMYEDDEEKARDDKGVDEDSDKDLDLEPAKLKMQRDQERRRYSKLKSEHEALAAKVAELERRERVADRKAELLGLEGEGIEFDMVEELELVADLEPAKFAKHVEHMRKRYQRSPVGASRIVPASVPAHGTAGEAKFSYADSVKAADMVKRGEAKNTAEAFEILKRSN